ncbi:MAG: 2-hydroxychromene-2-carboxylate isomerase [Alphaproteobacteria bacterium]|nr:2-hydroxychromene-2-carboxylate isomerase [Alphaproteobacteria bacterium]
MAGKLDFYFDFSSPYGYIAACRIDDIAAKHGREVEWRPFMLGATFKLTGGKPLTEFPLKGDYSKHDFARSARLHGIPFRMPSRFPISSITAARAFYWLAEQDRGLARRFALGVYKAFFAEDRDVSDNAVLSEIASGLGIDAAAMLEGTQKPEIKEKLKQVTDEAIGKRGVFGSPFVFVGDEPFWGADRLEMVDQWLARGGW